jgi:P27 family predicted phage terminase small subunit
MSNVLKLTEGDGGVPPEPNWNKIYQHDNKLEAAHRYWVGVINEMKRAGTITCECYHSIFRLVTLRIQYDECVVDVSVNGMMADVGREVPGNPYNPYFTLQKQCATAIKELEAELGLSPRRRASATKVKNGEKKTGKASDSYLNKQA